MQVYAADGSPLRGDLVTKVIERSDLTPIPCTVELEALSTVETRAAIKEGAVVQIGADQTEYLIVKAGMAHGEVQRGDRDADTIQAVGILNSCAALSRRLQRSIIREGSTFGEIYRSIGATAQVESDFAVPRFAALSGFIPTPEIAKVLQEEAAVVFFADGKVRFRRLTELVGTAAEITYPVDRFESMTSDLLERHSVPFVVTTSPSNEIVSTKRESARGAAYRPRGDTRILNNMGIALVQRRRMNQGLSPTVHAGTRIDIGGEPHIVITAAHIHMLGDDGGSGKELTQLWLGVLVQ